MSLSTFMCWLAWSFVLFMINPETTNWIGIMLFYASLFVAIVGLAAILGFLVRFIALKKTLAFRSVKEAFRQSFLFALLIIISLILLSKNLFTWLNLLFLISGLTILEFFLISYDKGDSHNQHI